MYIYIYIYTYACYNFGNNDYSGETNLKLSTYIKAINMSSCFDVILLGCFAGVVVFQHGCAHTYNIYIYIYIYSDKLQVTAASRGRDSHLLLPSAPTWREVPVTVGTRRNHPARRGRLAPAERHARGGNPKERTRGSAA